MPAHPSAPRAFDVAAAHFLADSSEFVSRFAWDGAARTWRDLGADGRPIRFEVVVSVATDLLHEALAAPDVPLVFRCVFAPSDTAAWLETVTSWEAERATRQATETARAHAAWEAAEERKRIQREAFESDVQDGKAGPLGRIGRPSLEPTPFTQPRVSGLVGHAQRERLLRAVSRRGVDSALRLSSGMPACRYVAQVAPVDVDPRAFLASLPRVSGSVVLQTALYAAYRDAIPDGARPMHERAFHALAIEVLGDGDPTTCRVKRRGLRYYRDLILPASGDGEDLDHNQSDPPRLRLVDTA